MENQSAGTNQGRTMPPWMFKWFCIALGLATFSAMGADLLDSDAMEVLSGAFFLVLFVFMVMATRKPSM